VLVRFRPRAATPVKEFLRPFEGVPCGVRPISQANKQGKQTSGGRIILSDEAKGVSL